MSFLANVSKLVLSTFWWDLDMKSRSPRLLCNIQDIPASTLFDSGAEVNAVDVDFPNKTSIGTLNTKDFVQLFNVEYFVQE